MENPDIVGAIVILEPLAPAAQVVRALQLVLVQLQQGQALGPACTRAQLRKAPTSLLTT